MHIFCLDYTVSVSKSYPLRVQNKLTTSRGGHKCHKKGCNFPHNYDKI